MLRIIGADVKCCFISLKALSALLVQTNFFLVDKSSVMGKALVEKLLMNLRYQLDKPKNLELASNF